MQALQPPIDLAAAFRGREILITGVTGFLGKVEIGRAHV
jgi:hypothetical protein